MEARSDVRARVASRWPAVACVGALALLAACTAPGSHARLLASSAPMPPPGEAQTTERVRCRLLPVGGSGAAGEVTFTERPGGFVLVEGEIAGLEPGSHGLHVYQYGDLSDPTAGGSLGGHFNPEEALHGAPYSGESHAGDLGNVHAGADGIARLSSEREGLVLHGPQGIAGRALVVDARADRFTRACAERCDPVAAGVIGLSEPDE